MMKVLNNGNNYKTLIIYFYNLANCFQWFRKTQLRMIITTVNPIKRLKNLIIKKKKSFLALFMLSHLLILVSFACFFLFVSSYNSIIKSPIPILGISKESFLLIPF